MVRITLKKKKLLKKKLLLCYKIRLLSITFYTWFSGEKTKRLQHRKKNFLPTFNVRNKIFFGVRAFVCSTYFDKPAFFSYQFFWFYVRLFCLRHYKLCLKILFDLVLKTFDDSFSKNRIVLTA